MDQEAVRLFLAKQIDQKYRSQQRAGCLKSQGNHFEK
jgi:hypothetical protein